MISYRTYPAIISTTTFLIVFTASAILMHLFQGICWLPRMGGVLVGVSVIIQSYMSVNIENFKGLWRWGLTKEQIYAHLSYHFAIVGTILWTFGDLFPMVLWFSNSVCTMH